MLNLLLATVLFTAGPYSPCEVTGQPVVIAVDEPVHVQTFNPKVPAKNLKEIEYITEDYKVCVEGSYSYGTRFFARYTVKGPKNLEEYMFIQYMRGYVYEIDPQNGVRLNNRIVVHHHFEGEDLFWHSGWVVDTDSLDPAYTASPGYKNRFMILHWNRDEKSFTRETEEEHGVKKSPYNHAYIADRPAVAFTNGTTYARESGLEFRTCLYNAKDVPRQIDPSAESRFIKEMKGKEISCHNWNSYWVFDYDKKEFKRLNEMQILPPAYVD